MSFKGFLFLAKKPYGLYVVDTRDPDPGVWKVQRLSHRVGGVGPNAVTLVDNDIMYLSPEGKLHLVSRTTDEDFGNQDISSDDRINVWMRTNANFAQLYNARMVYYAHKKEVHIAFAGAGDTNNTRRLIVDANDPHRLRSRTSDRDTAESPWLRQKSSIYKLAMGGPTGFVWDMDTTTYNKDSAAYTSEFQTTHSDLSHLDPSLSKRRKNGKWLEFVLEPKGNHNINVDVYWDGNLHETIAVNMGSGQAALGTFVLGTDTLAGNEVLTRRKRITGSGIRFSMGVRQTTANQNFSIAGARLHFKPGNERL